MTGNLLTRTGKINFSLKDTTNLLLFITTIFRTMYMYSERHIILTTVSPSYYLAICAVFQSITLYT